MCESCSWGRTPGPYIHTTGPHRRMSVRLRGPLGYLSKQELDTYFGDLRVKAAIATAEATAEAWRARPQTYENLEQVEMEYQSLG